MSIPTLSSSAILTLLSPYQQEELYYNLRKKHYERRPKDYISIQDKIYELEDKYFDIVWYARKTEEDRQHILAVGEKMTRIEEMYPREIHELMHNPDWSHGFNSGALAICRLLSAYACDSEAEDDTVKEISFSEILCENQDCDGNCTACFRIFSEYIESRKGRVEMMEDNFPMLDT